MIILYSCCSGAQRAGNSPARYVRITFDPANVIITYTHVCGCTHVRVCAHHNAYAPDLDATRVRGYYTRMHSRRPSFLNSFFAYLARIVCGVHCCITLLYYIRSCSTGRGLIAVAVDAAEPFSRVPHGTPPRTSGTSNGLGKHFFLSYLMLHL